MFPDYLHTQKRKITKSATSSPNDLFHCLFVSDVILKNTNSIIVVNSNYPRASVLRPFPASFTVSMIVLKNPPINLVKSLIRVAKFFPMASVRSFPEAEAIATQ